MTLPPSFPPGSSQSHPHPDNSPQIRHQAANQPTYPAFPSNPNGTNRPDLRTAVVVGSSATPATQHQGLSYTDLALPASYAPGSAANHYPGTPGVRPAESFQPQPAPTVPGSESYLSAEPPHSGAIHTRSWSKRIFLTLLTLLLALVLAIVFWGLFLNNRVNTNIGRTDALSGTADTPGTTWLIAGSDSREGTAEASLGVQGQRSDTIILVHQAANGTAMIVSLPRDSYVEIPGHGHNKLNAAFSEGGPALLVSTVEGLTGLTVDHYVQIGFNGVSQVVDGVGGINLCWDQTFSDRVSGLSWQAGCHDVDGTTALLFARMRYADPLGDIGRTQRQRLVISSTLKKALSPEVLINPARQVALADAGAAALTVDRSTQTIDIARLALALRKAGDAGLQGVPPIASLGYNPGGGVGSTVKLDENRTPAFWEGLRNGTLTPADLTPQF
ncbi:LCP family protein [Mobiluncus curtisii]|uniref:LCP family protein n=1 Tax=Mobiluncus curtisii TaxID=2051 RepID=UPI0001E0C3E3|nr:LCP family protein [Mobiluncus curtisii]EFL93802.1 cell envelope-like function transcriptional attenuator common domain protein [Mobiluncus curtisii subsp. curtisii ATCC 35241]NMW43412.1 transcriptional regulator [Mobiluncus curtisii]NMW88763.1 transcriptional regulator [Mobiluncus curtisii]QQT12754.1 LCP family protein [Mobiluncus curtisii]STY77681.1 Biofilm regulatory protein A precursor [Mobiluncus curtisii subsp. curtisii]